jgi:Tfp pilus assembly protein PilP
VILRSTKWMVLLALLSAPARAADEGGGGEKGVTIEDFLQQLSTVQGVVGRRDPFAELSPPFEMQSQGANGPDPDAPVMSAPVLERYSVAEYEVVAVLLGDNYPRALIRLPAETGTSAANRKVVIVKEGDKLGNRKGVISKIVLEGVIVQQAVRGAHGFVDKTEVLLKVGGKAEDQKKSLQTKATEQ